MKSHFTKTPLLIIITSLLISGSLIFAYKYHQAQEVNLQKKEGSILPPTFDPTSLNTKNVIPNRLPFFLDYLNQKGAQLKGLNDFQIKVQDRSYRLQLSHQTNIDTNLILLHHELATLQNSGLNEIDAQFLHFAHRNYQNPFTGQTITPNLLVSSNPESILMNIQGFCAGNQNPIAQTYHINLQTINSWIQTAHQYEENPLYTIYQKCKGNPPI